MRRALLPLLMLWAFLPNTLLGLLVGVIALLTGGGMQRCGRTIEFWGGVLPRLFSHLPFVKRAAALTLGHVILGLDRRCLARSRNHERVHVRQYERWGPLFLPAYFMSSAMQWMRRRDPYLDNHFEREAYGRKADIGASRQLGSK